MNHVNLFKIALAEKRDYVSPTGRGDYERLRALADDLAIAQRHCNVYFPVPDRVSADDRLHLRCARLLIEGKCVAVPRMAIINLELTGLDSPEIRDVLGGKPGILVFDQQEFGFEMFDRQFILGAAKVFNPKTVIRHSQEAIAALNAGIAEGFKIQIVPDGTKSFWTYLPDRWSGGADESPRPVGWGLEDFTDPPDSLLP